MTKQTINTGAAANDGTGDPARTAFTKINANINEVYTYLGDGLTLNKLGTAAFTTAVASTLDPTPGRLLMVGSGGWMARSERRTARMGAVNHIFCTGGSIDAGHGITWSNVLTMKNDVASIDATFIAQDIVTGKLVVGGIFNSSVIPVRIVRDSGNTTVDGSGFIKAASPIVQLFADKIELNDEARQQNIEFEKLGIGDYLIQGSTGFAYEGWYIEQPKDANGNTLRAVIYEQLENGDISVKTYKRKFDFETASIVADFDNPMDIPEDRWIDIRLQSLPRPKMTDGVNNDLIE